MSDAGEDIATVFEELGDLEKEFADTELDALRRKEFALKPLYAKRQALLERVPGFWPTVFGNAPEEVQQFFSPEDLSLLSSLISFSVDRYQIQTESKGEPRSLRFTFEFGANDIIEDAKLVKDFEYRAGVPGGSGNFVSKPVAIKFKNKKKDVTHGLLDAAVELYSAEEALKLKNGDGEIDIVDREALWQHEKLRQKMIKLDEEPEQEPSFFNWFGFRGAVNSHAEREPKVSTTNGTSSPDEEEEGDDDDEDQMLELEIFPAGDDVAITLAEELWTDAMDFFMSAQDEGAFDIDEDDEVSDDDDEAPELVPVEDDRPRKKQRKA
ncbi:hypothetical protein LTR84_012303 [Exophiala bonariae]|uniref:Uncharacterized protein n=1 Tax=Exophiala bonariae TaxID=1690606 RepID=A0AAV9NJG8_9EURO|nr:hypothetical protein LTR84_012303 [Exophiala bonariae]